MPTGSPKSSQPVAAVVVLRATQHRTHTVRRTPNRTQHAYWFSINLPSFVAVIACALHARRPPSILRHLLQHPSRVISPLRIIGDCTPLGIHWCRRKRRTLDLLHKRCAVGSQATHIWFDGITALSLRFIVRHRAKLASVRRLVHIHLGSHFQRRITQ